ncbi:MAG: hypothetical protein Athens101428_343 [Candidatus Berkelbacteria bacterium Athens1014_28]|uniref:Uncharacterized protein n=1 Tax=Candidatus Berkelbacteria bacterium Athens1014_28 TaxID=2017145 RepID=A0A554LN38_9BACT|nr:MAG: hypothetical protein Athens101428_343 [Candidatus Berkelbacteria bacterium Athens1014_28]
MQDMPGQSMRNTFLDAMHGNANSETLLRKRFGDWGYYELVRVFCNAGYRWRKVRSQIDRWTAYGVSFDTVAGEPTRTEL